MSSHDPGSTMNVTMATIKHPYVEIPYLFILIILGTVGNVSVIGALCVDRRLRKMAARLIANLAVCDVLIDCFYLPLVLANALKGYVNVVESVTWLCDVTGFLWPLCCQATAMTLLGIAFDRFWKIKNPQSYKKHFTPVTHYVIIAIIWVTSFLVVLPLITGWFGSGKLLTFDPNLLACTWWRPEQNLNIFLFVSAIFPPAAALAFYFLIFRHVGRRRRPIKEIASPGGSGIRSNPKIYAETSSYADDASCSSASQQIRPHHSRQNSINSHKTARLRRADERERTLMTSLAVVVAARLTLWLPYGVTTLLGNRTTPLVERICGWIAFAGSAVSCVIYALLCRHFRRAYVTLNKKLFTACPTKGRPVYDRSQAVKFG